MLTVDISLPDVDELQRLAQDAREKGFLTYDEIARALEEVELTKDQFDEFYAYLAEHGVDLMEGDECKSAPHAQPAAAAARALRRRLAAAARGHACHIWTTVTCIDAQTS